MKKFLNIIYYFSYKLSVVINRKLDRLTFFLLTPFKWIAFNTPFIRNRYIRLCGSLENAEKEMKKAYNYVSYNKEWGVATQYALAFYGGAISFYFWGVYINMVMHDFQQTLFRGISKHPYTTSPVNN